MNAIAGFESLERLKAACCLLDGDAGKGTGYLVAEKRIATCWHVVDDLPLGTRVRARFGDDSSKPPVVAIVAAVDRNTDAAILELAAPVPGATPLPLSATPLSRSDFTAFGFPVFAEPLGVALTGLVTDRNAEIPGKLRGFALFSQMLGANPPASVGGLSGSPVVVGDTVVGHISSVLGAGNAMQRPHLGYAYAVPVAGVLALLGAPVGGGPPPGSPTPPAEIVRLSEGFNRLQFAASGRDVRGVLSQAERHGLLTNELRLYAAEVLVSLALPQEALDALEGLEGERSDELRALSLSLQGKHAEALQYAPRMTASAEAQGIIGGVLKRRWLATNNPTHLRAAFSTYYQAYLAHGDDDHYPGINAAACALYLGDRAQSRDVAAQIVRQLADKKRDKWEQASYAEALLLCSDLDGARREYKTAVVGLGAGTRSLAVMRAQARRNVKYLELPDDTLDDALPREFRVAAFTGHRAGKDLPPERIPFVRERLEEILTERDIQFGYCSAASGSDILFIEALLAREAEVHVYLPFPAKNFIVTSVGQEWQQRFEQVIDRLGDRVKILSDEQPVPDEPTPYVRCNDAIQGAARDQAKVLGGSPLLIAVVAAVAEKEDRTPGGTADALRAWLSRGERDVERIDPQPESKESPVVALVPPPRPQQVVTGASTARLVFISYKHGAPYNDMARELDLKLRNIAPRLGYDVFLDRRTESGALWSKDVERALEATTHFVAFLCDPYWASQECKRELFWAIRRWEEAKSKGVENPRLLFVRAGEMNPADFTLEDARASGLLSKNYPLINTLSDVNFLGPYDLNDLGKLEILDWDNKARLDRQLGQLRDRFKALVAPR